MDDDTRRMRKNAPLRSRPRDAVSFAAEATFRARLAELGATLLEPDWLTKKKPHHVRCANGHDCYPLPANVNGGAGICRACVHSDPVAAEAAFRARIASLGGVVLGKYRDSRTAVHVRCPEGHDCYPQPNKIGKRGISCRTCSGRPDGMMAEAAFRARLAELGVTLLEPGWLGARAKHRAICAASHDCLPIPASLKRGEGACRVCAARDPVTAEAAFRAKVAELGGVVLGEYGGAHAKVHVRCAAGHDCYPRPNGVQRGQGVCLTCAGMDSSACEEKFRARLAELGATPLYGKWLGSGRPHLVRCSAGHDCRPRPGDVLQGSGICHVCRGGVWDAFYVTASDVAVKFGITSGDPRPRLRAHARDGLTKVVRLTAALPDGVALSAERRVRAALALAGEKPVRGREYFDVSCLALILDVADSWLADAAGPSIAAAEIASEWLQEALFAA